MSEKRKRRENIITALLIAGMCIVVGGTIIFVVKFSRGGDENKLLSAGMTEATDVSLESVTDVVSTTSVTSETTAPGTSETTEETTETTPEPTPTEEPTPTPEPEPEKLTSIRNLSAGTVLSRDEIDTDNLSQYFTSEEIEDGDSVYERI